MKGACNRFARDEIIRSLEKRTRVLQKGFRKRVGGLVSGGHRGAQGEAKGYF